MDIKNYDVKGTTKCSCEYEFTIKDFIELKRINEPGFYSNQVKHYSRAKCPNCNKNTILLLKQVGQTYKVIDIATKKEPKIENTEQKEETQGFICPECKKICKSQLGLNAHIKSHKK